MTVAEANNTLKNKYGNTVFCLIEPYKEDDGTVWYKYPWHDVGGIVEWNSFETVEEAYEDADSYLCSL